MADLAPAPPEAAELENSSTPGSKERHSLTLDQRRALRRWANSQTVRPSHKACIEWFESQYGQTISQSTVSHSLSLKYARLDGDPQLSGSRLRFGNWPDVEKLVLVWYQGMLANGRQPSNEELADKAKSIFSALPRYKEESPPEFSPGWIHRFKKRYGLLVSRKRRLSSNVTGASADDIPYLVDALPRFMSVSSDVSPAAIRDAVQRVLGVDATLAVCARARDEIVRRLDHPAPPPPATPQQPLPNPPSAPPTGGTGGDGNDTSMYDANTDPELVLQAALREMQEAEAHAEAEAAAAREDRDRADRGLPPLGAIAGQAYAAAALATPSRNPSIGPAAAGPRFLAPTPQQQQPQSGGSTTELTLTPISSEAPVSQTDRPVRCPFCVNMRMLRNIKEAVEHMSTHVVV